jgi:hypothetical protein
LASPSTPLLVVIMYKYKALSAEEQVIIQEKLEKIRIQESCLEVRISLLENRVAALEAEVLRTCQKI